MSCGILERDYGFRLWSVSISEWRKRAQEADGKLKEVNLVKEVRRSELHCVNHLTVAVYAKGKRRLCLDLLRCINKVVKAPSFKIESTQSARQIVEKEDFMILFI